MRKLLSEVDLLSTMGRMHASIGEIVYPPGGRFGPRWQTSYELVFVHTGSARNWIDDRPPLLIAPGWVCLQHPGHRELYEFDDEVATHHSWIELGIERRSEEVQERLAKLPRVLPISSAMADLLAEGVAASRMPLSTSHQLQAALGTAALWQWVGEAESSVRGGDDDAVERARRFIHAHLDDPGLDLAEVAGAAHVSAPHLVRRFRRELGVTPMAYLWQRRVTNGIDLLTSTGLPVGEVAMRSGFASVYHFSRRIKAHTGLAPTAVRREGWRRASPPPLPSSSI